jgi:hypothetical protein
MTEKRIFDGVAVILEAVDFVATVEENEWSRGRPSYRKAKSPCFAP